MSSDSPTTETAQNGEMVPTESEEILPDRTSDDAGERNRRNFLTACLASVTSGILALFPLLTGAFVFLDPLRSRRKGTDGSGSAADPQIDSEGFIRVAELNALPDDGTPAPFKIMADRIDAWTVFRNVPIGRVYLRKMGTQNVVAFNTTCPHAGCSVDYISGQKHFLCPCHDSTFSLDGSRGAKSPSARDLDTLQVKVDENHVWVKYQDFRTGTAEKIPEV